MICSAPTFHFLSHSTPCQNGGSLIVIVGGGAGGLELATCLGDKLGKHGKAHLTFIDSARTYVWKPLLYEITAGSLNSHADKLAYLAQAHWHHFRFRLGRMDGLARNNRLVHVAPTLDNSGIEIVPRRNFPYNTLVIAVGSQANDFGVPRVREHCVTLDTPDEARDFHNRLINTYLRTHTQHEPVAHGQLTVGIVGAGATGVELAAELHGTTRELTAYGLENTDPDKHVKLVIVEAAERIRSGLPPLLSTAVAKRLGELGVELHVNERVVEVRPDGFVTASGKFIPSSMMVWSAGIKAPDFLANLAGLETNRINQLVVRPTLQCSRDENTFAFGDCAACPIPGMTQDVPPRAQATHQQALMLVKSIKRRLNEQALPEYIYRDYGSPVALGRYSTVGNLMGGLTGGSLMIEGAVARLVYWSLHKMHQVALNGMFKTALGTIANIINSPNKPTIKPH